MTARRVALAALAVASIVAGCAPSPVRNPAMDAAPAVASAPAPAPATTTVVLPEEPVIARDRDFAVVIVQPGDDLARMAERWLGDRSRRGEIAEFNRIGEIRPGQIVAVPLKARAPYGVSAAGAQAVTILCYHRFGPRANALTVTPAAFEAQMAYLAKSGYSVVPLARVAAFLDGQQSLPPKAVVITIDDGYRSMYEVAYPILRRHRFPATVFLYTDFVGAPDALTWPQMREMVASGLVDVQPHSKTHSNLTVRQKDESDARYRERTRREVEAAADLIRAQLNVASHAYAFPYGDVNDAVVTELRAKGIRLGLTVTPGGNAFYAPPYMLRRTMVLGGDDLDEFRAKLVTLLPLPKP